MVPLGAADGNVLEFAVLRRGEACPFEAWVVGLLGDEHCRRWWNDTLAAAPFTAFRWETPGVAFESRARPTQFVLVNSPGLVVRPSAAAFDNQLRAAAGDVTTFPNLGGDAVLVVPQPRGPGAAYGHLGAFTRGAPAAQRDELWRAVGVAVAARIGPAPLWLSTAGAGVPWLHVRLDDRPKYYAHGPYRRTGG